MYQRPACPGRATLSKNHLQPFWITDALAREENQPSEPLIGEQQADVCIIGGGYTGLWSAIKLKQKKNDIRVSIIEKGLCGQGASGRNGGCMLTWSGKFPSLRKAFGESAAIELVKQSESAVGSIKHFCAKHGIEADIRTDGAIYTATNEAQLEMMNPIVRTLEAAGINQWQPLAAEELFNRTGSHWHLHGHYSPFAGSLHPGKLVRGLARYARSIGIQIYEHSSMQRLNKGELCQVITEQGQVLAKKVLLATNTWLPEQFSYFQRKVVLVSSDMVITKPLMLPSGLQSGVSVADLRTFVHYYRTTPDGRIMLGKGGNTFSFANKMRDFFEQPSLYADYLTQQLNLMFPHLPIAVERSWNGASDRSATGFPFFGRLPQHDNVFYALGYSGNGVVPCWLGGEILSSMMLGLNDDWTKSPLIEQQVKHFPPEPFRYLGALQVRNAIRRVEHCQDNNQAPAQLDMMLAKVANFAGKADTA